MLAAAPHASGPVIVLVAGGTDHHVGPARMWVDLSRQWAADGARVLRLDLSGIGDSGVRPGQAREITYAPEAIDDIVTAATAISPDDPSNVILVGFCAGAYAVMEAALRLLPSAVIVLNPLPYFDPPESAAGSDHDTARRLSQNRPTWLRRVARNPLAQRTRSRTPEAVWRLLHHLRVLQSPAAGFAALVDGGVHLSVVCSADDAEVYVRMSGRELARLTRTRRFSFVADPELSHVLKSRYERERCADMLTERVRRARVESVPATAAGTLPSPVERRARPRP
jgi:pimeloyl-ACP methyl ester carboxylesterase